MAHVHSRGVAHLDMKLENVLLCDTGAVKLIDFGLAHTYADAAVARQPPLHPERMVGSFCGSHAYAAPEVLAMTSAVAMRFG